MIIALFGPSCTGKTTLALRLGKLLGLPLRSCGEAVRTRAMMLGVSLHELSYDEHRRVDAETREWVLEKRPCLVEGRYLHSVLATLGREIVLIRLEASEEDWRRRDKTKHGRPASMTSLQERERNDLDFSKHMYSIGKPLAASLVLNSSEMSVEACVQRVKSLIENIRVPPG
jgi:cytidylate kinase